MKKTITSLSALGTIAIASPAFAHHSEQTSLLANIAHWLLSPLHGLVSLAAIALLSLAAVKLLRKNTQV